MSGELAKGAEQDPAADPGGYTRAILNILADFGEEKARLQDTQKAVLNILEDAGAEKLRIEATQKAVLNILADFDDEKSRLADVQKAILNIIEDAGAEKLKLEDAQKATLNILEDFDAEKNKVEGINREMAGEIAERKRAEERLAAQYAMTRVLAEASSLGEATPKLLRAVCESLGWELGEIWEVDRRANVLRCAGMWCAPALSVGDFEAVTRETSFAPGVGLPGRVWSTAKPIWIPDVLKDPTFVRAVDAAKGGLHAAFGFPILIAGEVVGVVDFQSLEIRPPDNDLMQMISALGSQIGQFIERKRAEEEIRTSNAQLEAANKELEAFSYSVSHDLRSPLRAIDGFSRLLTEDYGGKFDDEGRRLLDVIRDSSKKMGQLIDDLLTFSRLGRQSLSAAEIDMKRLVEDVLKGVHMAGDQRSKLVLKALPPARGDATLLKQVWANLLGNAIKFSGKRERPVVEVSGHEDGTESVYCVKDNGAGFDMRYYDKLFGVFQRLHRTEEFAGTGVGLAIVQRVVLRHGGRVWAEGKVGEGAAFYFSLPRGGPDGQI